MSSEFREYLGQEEDGLKISMLKHEIAVVIKGRSKESFDIYKRVPPLSTGLPIKNEADKGFVWRVYERYREQLEIGGQFDTDDVVLTASVSSRPRSGADGESDMASMPSSWTRRISSI